MWGAGARHARQHQRDARPADERPPRYRRGNATRGGDLNAAATVIAQPAAPMLPRRERCAAPCPRRRAARGPPSRWACPPAPPRAATPVLATALVPEIEHIVAEALGIAHAGERPSRTMGMAPHAGGGGETRRSVDRAAAAEPTADPAPRAWRRRLGGSRRGSRRLAARRRRRKRKEESESWGAARGEARGRRGARRRASARRREKDGKTESKDRAGAEKKAAKGAPVNSRRCRKTKPRRSTARSVGTSRLASSRRW